LYYYHRPLRRTLVLYQFYSAISCSDRSDHFLRSLLHCERCGKKNCSIEIQNDERRVATKAQ